MKQNLIGLVWRNIPKISQHKLSYSSNANDFENWCNETINDYQKLNIEYANLFFYLTRENGVVLIPPHV